MRIPELRPAFHALWALLAPAAFAAPLQLNLLGVDGKGVAGTVVILRSTSATAAPAPPVRATIDQLDLRFVPHLLVVPVGSEVNFPNTDKVSHQVYSFSPAKRFQLELYRGKPYPPVLFDQRGTVTLGCNIHDQMRAYVYVVEAQYYGRTDAEGRWHLPEVTPGEYMVQVWHPQARDSRPLIEQTVSIQAATATLTLRLAAMPKLRPQSQIPPNWDNY